MVILKLKKVTIYFHCADFEIIIFIFSFFTKLHLKNGYLRKCDASRVEFEFWKLKLESDPTPDAIIKIIRV